MIQHEFTSMEQNLWADHSHAQEAARQLFPQLNSAGSSTIQHSGYVHSGVEIHAGPTITDEHLSYSVRLMIIILQRSSIPSPHP